MSNDFQEVRIQILSNVMKEYIDFINKIRAIPIHEHAKKLSFDYFDTGLLWFKEGISNLQPLGQSQSDPATEQVEQSTAQEEPVDAA